MDIPVFHLKSFRRNFYYFFVGCVLIAISSMAIMAYIEDRERRLFTAVLQPGLWLAIIAIGTMIFNARSKAELKRILEIPDFEVKFKRYEKRYIRQLVWNAVSVVLTGAILISTQKDFMFYILIIQVI